MSAAGLFCVLLSLTSCHRDAEPLDRLSHAFTSFLDRYFDTEVSSFVPLIGDNPNNPYWDRLEAALNMKATNALRARAASECITAYDTRVSPWMDQFSEATGKLDAAVLELIESANSIHDQEWRTASLVIAKSAREAQINFAAIHELASKRFELQMKIMHGLIDNGGDIMMLFQSDARGSEENSREIARISKDIDARRAGLATAKQSARDAFSALKGKTGLREHPTKEAIEETKEKPH
jgi:hypothetical protein